MTNINYLFGTHPWTGTQHCLRQKDGKEFACVNDHTGCIYNDGHNTCCHPAPLSKKSDYDCPLVKKDDK